MPEIPDKNEPESWHRFFAIECNNRAWELVEKPRRSENETREMLDTAHSAAFHWSKVGTELNVMRSQSLLAETHAIVGLGESAVRLSGPVRSYFLTNNADDWEIAYAHSIHAHACFSAGLTEEYRDSYKAAEEAIDAIQDEQDRIVVLRTFNQIPQPGQDRIQPTDE